MIYAEVFAMGLNAFILFRVWWDWSGEGVRSFSWPVAWVLFVFWPLSWVNFALSLL
jgi:hypothetical protein